MIQLYTSMNNKLTITISIDSSHKDGKAACAHYINHECFVVKDSGYIGNVSRSVEAECYSIIIEIVLCTNDLNNNNNFYKQLEKKLHGKV